MNVREEDRQKNSCPSRGLGLAAAAIGVGVGAALYYFFSKRPENPDGEGSTTSGWTCEQPHAFSSGQTTEHDDSYITISENSTSDTSVHDSNTDSEDSSEEWVPDSSSEDSSEPSTFGSSAVSSDYSSELSVREFEPVYTSQESFGHFESSQTDNMFETTDYLRMPQFGSDSDTMDWDITNSSLDVPVFEFPRSPVSGFNIIQAARHLMSKEEETLRQQAFRERSWSLEECSICFDIILKDQQVTTLPCTHHFHSACITPWLQEQQTCPNCRKAAE